MLFLVAASVLWAFSFGLIKGQLAGLDPVAVAWARLALAAVVFAPLIGRGRASGAVSRQALALGALQFGAMYVLYLASYRWLPAWLVAMLTVLTPLYVVLLSAWQRGRLGRRHLAAALLAVCGGAVVTLRSGSGGDIWPGVVLLQAANVCFALGQVRFAALKRESGVAEGALLGWMYAGGAAVTTLAVLAVWGGGGQPWTGWHPRALLVVAYLGLLPTALGFYLWNKGAARTAPGLLAAANNLKVPLGVLAAWAVFGEQVDVVRAAAGLVLLLGALVIARDRRSINPPPYPESDAGTHTDPPSIR